VDRVRLPNSAHEGHPWVVDQVAPDFKLLDVWALPAEGGPGDFGDLVEVMTGLDPSHGDSSVTRALFWLRHRLGDLFGWDDAGEELPVPGRDETTLSARLPEDLRDSTTPPLAVSSSTFIPLYRTDDEWAAEISNRTVHAILHLAWIEQGSGAFRGQLGIYVKPRGRLGEAYMALIGPFRHLVVYPALMREVERAWEDRTAAASAGPADVI
jgi:hypothetical protein